MAKPSGKSQRLSLYNNGLNLAMSFYIAPYRYFSYIQAFLQVFSLYISLYRGGVLPIYVCFPIYIIETLIIGVFLYIQKKPSFFFCILPQKCVFYIYSVFPIVKITLFCLYISFYFAQIVVYVFLYIGNIIISFPIAILFAL